MKFLVSALKEWRELDASVRKLLKARLLDRLERPHVPSCRLRGMPGHYKIKLRASGWRLVYAVEDDALVVIVNAVGKRDRSGV
ncbi:MAG: type II toxin-antitoxin system RelE/ParE family toxin [Mariprofundaceae bacterium]